MDYISREAALNFEMSVECSPDEIQGVTDGMALYAEYIKQLPAADAVEVVRCRECKHFQLNAWGTVNGVPLIVAHEICDFWADGCKTNQDGYCFAGERKDDDENG